MKRFLPYFLLFTALAVGFMHARIDEDPQFIEFRHVRSDVNTILKKNKFVVVYAYHMPESERWVKQLSDGEKEHSFVWHEVIRISHILDQYAKDDLYEGRVFFLATNLDRGDMTSFSRDYNIKGDAILLIKDGKIIGQTEVTIAFQKSDFQKLLSKANFEDFLESARRIEEEKAQKKAAVGKKERSCKSCVNVGVEFGVGVYPGFYDLSWNGPFCYTCRPWWW